MSQLKLSGDASGTGIVTVAAPNTNSTYTVTLPAAAGTLARTDAAQTFTGTQTFSSDASVNGTTVGRGAGAVATNTAVGASALAANTSGDRNTALGNTALYSNQSGQYNVALGDRASYSNTSGSNNISIGSAAMYANTTGANNVGIGRSALESNTTGVATFGTVTGGSGYTNGTYNGVQLTYSSGTTATTYPTANIVVSGGAVTTVTLVSAGTGFKDTTTVLTAPAASIGGTGSGFTVPVSTLAAGSNNTAVGYQAGYSNTASTGNTFIGAQAGQNYNNTSGAGNNVIVGYFAGNALTSGIFNTLVGTGQNGAGAAITTGSKNTVIGAYSGNQGGLDIRTSSNYIVLSDGDGNPRGYFNPASDQYFWLYQPSGSYYTAVAYKNSAGSYWWNGATTGATPDYRLANQNGAGVYISWGGTSWSALSDERKKDIIEPISDAVSKVNGLRAVIGKYKADTQGIRRPFLIAQDIQAVLPEAVSGYKEKDDDIEYLGVSYTDVIPLLVAAIKELKSELDSVKAELAALKGA